MLYWYQFFNDTAPACPGGVWVHSLTRQAIEEGQWLPMSTVIQCVIDNAMVVI